VIRYAAYVLTILLLATLQMTLPRLPVPTDLRPLLMVPAILWWAMNSSMVEGAALSCFAGFVEDALTPGFQTGLGMFTDVLVFLLARIFLAAVRADGWFFEILFAFGLAAAHLATSFGIRRLFGAPMASFEDTPWVVGYFYACLSTALACPLVFFLTRRVEKLKPRVPGILS